MNKQFEKAYRQYEEHCKKILKSTTIDIHETAKDKASRIKKLESVYANWFEYYLPHYAISKCAWFHKKAAKLLIDNKEVFLLQRIFRGGAKSVHANIGIPLYLYFAKKDLFFMLLIGETEPKANKLLSDIQAELESNKRFANDYGSRFKFGNWADGNFSTTDDVHFFALGIGQSARGVRNMANRPDYISVDDVDTKKRAKNPKLTREAFEYLKEDIWGTFGAGTKRYVQSNNRFSKTSTMQLMSEHFDTVREEYKEKKLPVKHHIIIAKMINDEGESSWPEAYPLCKCEEIRIDRGERSFQREYQDNPIENGTVFKNEWIQYKQRLPLHQYDSLGVYGDLSYSDVACYKALILGGKLSKEFHIIKCMVRQTSRAIAASWLFDLYEELKLKKYNISYRIEGNFAQGDIFIPDFDSEGDKRGYHIPVVADKKTKANKFERIESMSGFFERGDVYFNSAEKGSRDFKELEDQILAFEKGSSYPVDGPDALQSLIDELNQIRFIDPHKSRTKSRKELIKTKKNRF